MNKTIKKEQEIIKEQLIEIIGSDWKNYQKIFDNCHCSKCDKKGYSSTIVDYKIFINDLNDVILRGRCAKCGSPLNRYSETGEVEEYLRRIKKVIK